MNSFTKTLTDWYRANKRDLPWRDTRDTYSIWLSEIILQQTRVDQGLPYWERFMKAFPQVTDLAAASEEEVLRHWQGLGYYSRARNLHATAKYVAHELNGQFPTTYDEIIKLKGIGPYTAAAIASICYDEARPVVDGNVFRFVARFFGIQIDIAASSARNEFVGILMEHIPPDHCGEFNQALMEFGATVCAPSPDCTRCPFSASCFAYEKGLQKELPIKRKKIKVRDRYLNYLVIRTGQHLLMQCRTDRDVWKGLYDFWPIEGEGDEETVLNAARQLLDGEFTVDFISSEFKHLLSHQKILARFFELHVNDLTARSVSQKTQMRAFSIEEILNLPKPKLIVNYLNQRDIK